MSMYVALDAGFPKSFVADYVADVDLPTWKKNDRSRAPALASSIWRHTTSTDLNGRSRPPSTSNNNIHYLFLTQTLGLLRDWMHSTTQDSAVWDRLPASCSMRPQQESVFRRAGPGWFNKAKLANALATVQDDGLIKLVFLSCNDH